MKKLFSIASLAAILLAASCSRYNPFDSYSHPGFEREDMGGKPGRGGLFDGGYGTEESPYGLSTPQHLKNIARGLVEGEMIYFKMLNDIDMEGVSWTALNPTEPYQKFIDFDGGGHIITNLTVTSQKYGSFFGVLCGNCHDVGFVNANVQSSNACGIIGGYVGLASPSDDSFTGRVERVYATGTVTAPKTSNAGALCGELGKMVDMTPCVISDCYTIVDVIGAHTGGLAGQVRSGSRIENSYAMGNISGNTAADRNDYAGGLVGNNNGGIISNSIAWNPTVKGKTAGKVYGNKPSGTVENCYASDELVTTGTVAAQEGVTVKNKAGLQAVATAWSAEKGSGWYTDGAISNGYPILKWQQERGDFGEYSGHGGTEEGGGEYTPGFKSGTGTESDPFIISTLSHLRSMHDLLEPGNEYWLKLEDDINANALAQWDPLNVTDPYNIKIHFDGNGKTIKKLKSKNCKYAGFFGVLNGECKDVTFEDCVVLQTDKSPCGILGGYAGSNGGAAAVVSGVKVTGNSSVNISVLSSCGMLFGVAVNATFSDCSVSGNISSSYNSSNKSESGGPCGGIVGKAGANTVITGCTNKCTINAVRLVGGIVGYVNAAVRIEGCTNNGAVTSTAGGTAQGERTGGIAGHIDAGTTITKCSNSGNIEAEQMSGGIVGYIESNNNTTVISRCYSTGNVKSWALGQWAGGICGYMASGEINNCWSSGDITIKSQMAGGIVAEIKSGYLSTSLTATKGKVINCYSKANLSGQRVLGGIAGRCAHDGWQATATDPQKISDITVTGCIAWNSSIQAPSAGPTNGSSGAVVAYSYIKNNLGQCWRNPNMTFTANADYNKLSDQDDVSPANPLPTQPASGDGSNIYPYHGKAAPTDKTISNLASELGWDTEIWNLGGSEPVLK